MKKRILGTTDINIAPLIFGAMCLAGQSMRKPLSGYWIFFLIKDLTASILLMDILFGYREIKEENLKP